MREQHTWDGVSTHKDLIPLTTQDVEITEYEYDHKGRVKKTTVTRTGAGRPKVLPPTTDIPWPLKRDREPYRSPYNPWGWRSPPE